LEPLSDARVRFKDTQRGNTSLVLNLASRAREHRITTGSGGSGDFLLHNIPVFHQLAVDDTKNVHRNHRLRTPTGVTAVNHHQVAFRDDHSCLVTKSCSQLANWPIGQLGRELHLDRWETTDCVGHSLSRSGAPRRCYP